MKKITRLFGSLLILLMMVAACSKDSYEPKTIRIITNITNDGSCLQ